MRSEWRHRPAGRSDIRCVLWKVRENNVACADAIGKVCGLRELRPRIPPESWVESPLNPYRFRAVQPVTIAECAELISCTFMRWRWLGGAVPVPEKRTPCIFRCLPHGLWRLWVVDEPGQKLIR